jgi:hypothetical protein
MERTHSIRELLSSVQHIVAVRLLIGQCLLLLPIALPAGDALCVAAAYVKAAADK